MRKKSLITFVIMVFSMVTIFSSTAMAAGWQINNTGWWWLNDDGTYPAHQWVWLDGNNDGISESYYFDDAGYLVVNTTTPDGYTVDANGAWYVDGMVQVQATDGVTKVNPYPATITNNTNNSSNNVNSRPSTIQLIDVNCTVNSVGGVTPHIYWWNGTGKTIKYITFTMVPFNRVGDPQACTIRGHYVFNGRVTGPVNPDDTYGKFCYLKYNSYCDNDIVYDEKGEGTRTTQDYDIAFKQNNPNYTFTQHSMWDCAWYNDDINSCVITNITVEYMDGTTETISDESVTTPMFWNGVKINK